MSFSTTDKIELQPNTSGLVYAFNFPISTSATRKSGFLPNGTTISGVEVYGYNNDTNTTSSGWYSISTFSTDTVNVELSYPGADARYKITFVLTLSNGAVIEADFENIEAKDN